METDIFIDSLEVSITGEGTIFYRIADGAETLYTGPFTVTEPCTLEAWSISGGRSSFVTRSRVRQVQKDRAINILSRYSRQYNAGGDEGLIDGTRGGINWRTGGWQGYQDTDFTAVLDLLEERPLSIVGAGFCQDARSWIWMPRYVEFSVSADGISFIPAGRLDNSIAEDDMTVQVWDAELPVNCTARYVKVFAKNIGPIPEWHPGAGAPGFIFVDELWAR
jgi:hypothetical protein